VKPVWNRALAVGVVAALAGTAFIVAITFFRKGGYSERESYAVHAYFRDATGLTWKSRVQIAGIQIGEVAEITLEGDRARLDLRVKKGIVLHADACLTKTFPSALLPDALLEAAPGRPEAPALESLPEEEREIKCIREAVSVQELMDSLSRIARDVQVVTGDLARTVGGQQGSLSTIIENVSQITRDLQRIVGQNGEDLNAIIANTRGFTEDLRDISESEKERIRNISRNVETVTVQLKDVLSSVQQILGTPGAVPAGGGAGTPGAPGAPGAGGTPGAAAQAAGEGPTGTTPEAQAAAGGVRQAVDKLNDSLAKLDEILSKVNEGKSVAGRLLTDEKMGRQLGTAVEGVSNYVDNLVKLQLEVNLRSEWLMNQVGAKTYFGVRILPRPDKYYILEVVADPRGVDTVSTETITTRDPTTGRETTTVSTKSLHEDKLTLTLQFAKRYGPLTFRVGIIESSGGVGADLHMLKDSLQLSLSVYQFTRPYQDVFPRAKVWVNWYFLQHFYATAGADDFLNSWNEGRYPGGPKFTIGNDIFFGGGIYFTDDDLKTLIGTGAGSSVNVP
jgi:phospholipid/cholesterol/gamma-HCH transport system substrate-binding protein